MNPNEAVSEEQAADLAALQSSAAETPAHESAAAQQAQAQATSAQQDMASEIKSLLEMALQVLGPALPSLKTIYTQETMEGAAQAVAAVCVKHGWLDGGLFAEWGEEIAAAAVLLPLGYITVQGVKADILTAKKAQGIGQGATIEGTAIQQTPAQKDAGKTVQFGTVEQ